MELYCLTDHAFYNDINNTNRMNKSVYFILFLHVNIDNRLMRHVCTFKKNCDKTIVR